MTKGDNIMFRYICKQTKYGKTYIVQSKKKLKVNEFIFAHAPEYSKVVQVYAVEELTDVHNICPDEIVKIHVPRSIRTQFKDNTYQFCKIYLTEYEPFVIREGRDYRNLCDILTKIINETGKIYVANVKGNVVWAIFEFASRFSDECKDKKNAISYESFGETIYIEVKEVPYSIHGDESYIYDYYRSHKYDYLNVHEAIKNTPGYSMKNRINKAFSGFEIQIKREQTLKREDLLDWFRKDGEKVIKSFANKYKNAIGFRMMHVRLLDYKECEHANSEELQKWFKILGDIDKGVAIEVKAFYVIEAIYNYRDKYCVYECDYERKYID